MQLKFLSLPPGERQVYFVEAAARRNLHAAILEKDFWVCWLLAVLFDDPELRDSVVFKGGTSLSKVHGAIERFSEDIDLSVSPSTSNLKFAAGSDEFRVRCTKKYPAVVPQTHALAFGESAANFGFGVLVGLALPKTHSLQLPAAVSATDG